MKERNALADLRRAYRIAPPHIRAKFLQEVVGKKSGIVAWARKVAERRRLEKAAAWAQREKAEAEKVKARGEADAIAATAKKQKKRKAAAAKKRNLAASAVLLLFALPADAITTVDNGPLPSMTHTLYSCASGECVEVGHEVTGHDRQVDWGPQEPPYFAVSHYNARNSGPAIPVPEPAVWLGLLTGLVGLSLLARWKGRHAA